MNSENAARYLPLVKALADGKTLQVLFHGQWVDEPCPSFSSEPERYRIKPTALRFRVAVLKDTAGVHLQCFTDEYSASKAESSPYFVKWATDWIETEE